MQHELSKQEQQKLKQLCEKHQIKINPNNEHQFQQFLQRRCYEPKFYFELKKRPELLNKKRPKKKEPYHVTYLRQIEEEK